MISLILYSAYAHFSIDIGAVTKILGNKSQLVILFIYFEINKCVWIWIDIFVTWYLKISLLYNNKNNNTCMSRYVRLIEMIT